MDSDEDDLILGADESELNTMSDAKQEQPIKKRKVHMTCPEIFEFNKTSSGSAALKNPIAVAKSLQDPHKGLYPKENRKKNSSNFQNATSLLFPNLEMPENNLKEKHTQETQGGLNHIKKTVMQSPIKQSRPGSIVHYCIPSTSQQLYTNVNSSRVCDLDNPGYSQEERDSLSQSPPKEKRYVSKVDVTKRLFEAQKSLSPKKSPTKKKSKAFKKGASFNRDNTFLYSNTIASANQSDPLSFGVEVEDHSGNESSTDSILEEYNYFQNLPIEVVHNIFCRLPFLDLRLNVNRVCSQWNDVVSDENVCMLCLLFF